jgi:hypothetical protein
MRRCSGRLALAGPPAGSGAQRQHHGRRRLRRHPAVRRRRRRDHRHHASRAGDGSTDRAHPGWRVLENLRIRDLRVVVGDGTWFMADEARAQLSGELSSTRWDGHAHRRHAEGTRGQYTLIAGPIVRRFDIVSAQVRFLGAPTPNPAIDITARRIVFDPGGRELAVDVRITGTWRRPACPGGGEASASPSRSCSASCCSASRLRAGRRVPAGRGAARADVPGRLRRAAAIELERGLGGLGLDIFQIRLGGGPLGGLGSPTVVMGRQLRPTCS